MVDWNAILIAVIGAATTVITTFVVAWLKSLYENNKYKTKNEKVQFILNQVNDIISAAVITTNNTYVKELKRNNIFTVQAQKEAFRQTYDIVIKQLTDESKTIITQVYGNLESYLTIKIEQFVEEKKDK